MMRSILTLLASLLWIKIQFTLEIAVKIRLTLITFILRSDCCETLFANCILCLPENDLGSQFTPSDKLLP